MNKSKLKRLDILLVGTILLAWVLFLKYRGVITGLFLVLSWTLLFILIIKKTMTLTEAKKWRKNYK